MRKRTVAFLMLTAVISAVPAFAGSVSAPLNVSVQVIARTILTVDSQPVSIEITDADVARGYIDLPGAIAFRIRSNASSGYSLQFQPVAYPFARADVNWDNSLATIGADGSWLTRPYSQGTTIGTMNVRLTLAPGTRSGSYAWPIVFAADSL